MIIAKHALQLAPQTNRGREDKRTLERKITGGKGVDKRLQSSEQLREDGNDSVRQIGL